MVHCEEIAVVKQLSKRVFIFQFRDTVLQIGLGIIVLCQLVECHLKVTIYAH